MPPEQSHLAACQAAFAARLRDPRHAPRPAGLSARRMRVYEQLYCANIESFLLACYPVTRKLLGKRAWQGCVRRFCSQQRSHSPLFRDIAKAFLDWLQADGMAGFAELPFLAELMHYEWLELAVSIAAEEIEPAQVDGQGDLLLACPALNPTARLACYHYPVHRVGPRYKPVAAAAGPYCYLLFRDAADAVRFCLLTPLAVQLLELLRTQRISGAAALARLAGEGGSSAQFIAGGSTLLADLRAQGALLGTWRTPC
jgi:hypothetical protein